MRRAVLIALCMFAATVNASAKDDPPFVVYFHARAEPPTVSPEGFVETSNKELQDSATDVLKALDGNLFHPNKRYPGSVTRFVHVADPAQADLILTVAARGVDAQSYGARTETSIYRNVVRSNTTPIVGMTRWISVVMTVGTYEKEFSAFSTNRSAYSAGSWNQNARTVALSAAEWVMANEPQIKALQAKRGIVAPVAQPLPVEIPRTCQNSSGKIIPCPK